MLANSGEWGVGSGERRRKAEGGRRRAERTVVSGQWSVVSPIPNPQSLIPNPSRRRKKGDSPHLPERPGGCCAQTGTVPLFPARRGVLLLIVLALLAMFGLVAVAFVVLTGQAQRSAKSIERVQQGDQSTADAPPAQDLLQQAAMQVFHGSTSPTSVMAAHGLLEDIYGTATVTSTVTNATVVSGGLQITNGLGATVALRGVGGILTISAPTTSPSYGQIAQVVSVDPTTGAIQTGAFPNGSVPRTGDTLVLTIAPGGTISSAAP